MKSQSLSMRTIVMVIIILIVIAVVLIMFMTYMHGSLNTQTNTSIWMAKNLTDNATG